MELVLNQRLLRRRCGECSGKGCPRCLGTGYRGRLPLVERLRITGPLRRCIAAHDFASLVARPSLADSAQGLVEAQLTTQAEVTRVLGFPFS